MAFTQYMTLPGGGTETIVTQLPRLWKPGTGRLIVGLHGRNGDSALLRQFESNSGIGIQNKHFLRNNYRLISCDAGGPSEWGNDNAMDKVLQVINWARGGAGNLCDPSLKVVLLGYSMGGVTSLNFIKRHPDLVAGMIGFTPATQLPYFYNKTDGGGTYLYRPEMQTAYGGAANYATNAGAVGDDPSHNPLDWADTITTPLRFYTPDPASPEADPTVPASTIETFLAAAASPNKVLEYMQGGYHTMFWPYINNEAMISWLGGLSW